MAKAMAGKPPTLPNTPAKVTTTPVKITSPTKSKGAPNK